MSCPCRTQPHPRPLAIPAGLTRLPRMIACYGEFRRAMLSSVGTRSELGQWVAREPGDLGVLAIEMWALACQIIAFADETICHECYLRTARLDESTRRVLEVLGYRPRPAVAASVDLTVQVSGRRTVTLPRGLPVRSGAVGDDPPQVFELLADAAVHPCANGFTARPNQPLTLGDSVPGGGPLTLSAPEVLVEGSGLRIDSLVAIEAPGVCHIRRIVKATDRRGPGPQRRTVTFDAPAAVDGSVSWSDLSLRVPAVRKRLWTLDVPGHPQPGISTVGGVTTVILDSLQRSIQAGHRVVLERDGRPRWFSVVRADEVSYRLGPDVSYPGEDGDYTLPGASVPVTRLVLDTSVNDPGRRASGDAASWGAADASRITVHCGWAHAASFPTPPATDLLPSGEAIEVAELPEIPSDGHHPGRFILVDRDDRAVVATGSIDWSSGAVDLSGASWTPPLRPPVRVLANVVTASRGESVTGEILGSGDASRINQVFALSKSPLTYLGPSASGTGDAATSTLTVRVDGVTWQEIPHFVGAGPADHVYVVRHDEDGGTEIQFGDGVRGARLTTGESNVVADYRFGAGAGHPSAGTVTQLVDPTGSVLAISNPAPAYGGAEAATAAEIRADAPRSALLLGRIVSRADAAAAARSTPGVVTATAETAWSPERLAAAIVVRYVGDPSLAAGLRARLRALCERDVRIDAVVSPPRPITLTIGVTPDPRYRPDDVRQSIIATLTGQGGVLSVAALGIDGPLFRSRLAAAVLAVNGVGSIHAMLLDGQPFEQVAVAPPDGGHLDATSGLHVTVEGGSDGA